MNKQNYLIAAIGVLSAATVVLSILLYRSNAALSFDPPAVKFLGESISQSQLDRQLEAQYGLPVLEEMITKRLIEKAVARENIKVPEAEINLWLADYKKRPDAQEIIFSKQLDETKLRNNLKTSIPLYYLALKGVTPSQQKQYFTDHKKSFEELELKHILLGSEEEAFDIAGRTSGEDSFSAMALVHSLDQQTRDIGGSLGRVTREELENSFDPLSVEELFAAKLNSVSEPMQSTSGGWHLFYIKNRTLDYDSLKLRVVEAMAQQRLQKCLEGLRDQAKVEILLKDLGPKGRDSQGNSDSKSVEKDPKTLAEPSVVPTPIEEQKK